MTITRNFKLYLNAGTASAPYINVNQYDEGEEWVFTLYNEDGSTYTPSSGAIIGIKSDGNAIMNAGSVVGGKVVITETEQMTAASGRAIFELLIDNATHGTANFIVNVERRPSDDAEFSDSDLSMLQEAIDAAEVINEILDEDGDPSEIITENVNAWLDNHPEATTTVEDGAITAPKINNSLWDKLLVSEEASGNPASFNDGADDVPVSSLKVALEPIQTGSGDPSPSNVRPIIAANGKNLLQNTATSKTESGITFTVNADGTITVNGTATANTYLYFLGTTQQQWQTNGQALTLTGCPSDGSNSTYRIIGRINGDAWITDTGSGANIPNTATYINNLGIGIQSGTVCNNLVFKPMIRLASITDSTYQPYQSIMVEQTGRNLLPPFVVNVSWESGNATVVGTGDGAYKFNGTTTGYQQSVIQSDIPLKAGTYTFGVTVEASETPVPVNVQLRNVRGGITYATASWTSPAQTFTLAEDTAVRMRFVVPSALTFNNVIIKPQIELGNTATTYEPYQSTSYPYTLGQSVYGGTIDLATGVLTVDKMTVTFDGSSDEAWSLKTASRNYMQIDLPYMMAYYTATETPPIISNIALPLAQNATYGQYEDSRVSAGSSTIGSISLRYVCAGVTDAMTVDEFKTWLASNPLQVVYLVKTPLTIQLTPQEVKTLLGYNNISSTGTVDVIYHADTKLYIDKKIGELS